MGWASSAVAAEGQAASGPIKRANRRVGSGDLLEGRHELTSGLRPNHGLLAHVFDDAAGAWLPGTGLDDIEVPVPVHPNPVTGAVDRAAPTGQPLAVEGQDADQAGVVFGDIDDVLVVDIGTSSVRASTVSA